MKKYKWIIIVLNLMIVLLYFNLSIFHKEQLLKGGHLVYLELAPVDPRSLLQGDYMALRYSISRDIQYDSLPKRGYCVVTLDPAGIASLSRFQKDQTPLYSGEYLIEYTIPEKWQLHIGAESYFFQEGQAKKYEKAKYGGIKIDKAGNSLLVGLYDEQLHKIE